MLDLLGVRKTVGSSDCLPPSKEALLATFTAPHQYVYNHNKEDDFTRMFEHSPNSKLSVGARALAKHCHRDDSLQWWGECTGCKNSHYLISLTINSLCCPLSAADEDKNSHALDRALTIMREAAWINIHSLPVSATILHRGSSPYH